MELDPAFALAQTWLGWCLFNHRTRGDAEESRAAFERAVTLAPQAADWERFWIASSRDISTDVSGLETRGG